MPRTPLPFRLPLIPRVPLSGMGTHAPPVRQPHLALAHTQLLCSLRSKRARVCHARVSSLPPFVRVAQATVVRSGHRPDRRQRMNWRWGTLLQVIADAVRLTTGGASLHLQSDDSVARSVSAPASTKIHRTF